MRVMRGLPPPDQRWSGGLPGGWPGILALASEPNGLGAVDARSSARDRAGAGDGFGAEREPASAADDAADDAAEQARFVALLPLHAATLLRVAAALVGPADAEDAAQEAIVRAWQAWSSLRDPAAARAWLLRITVNVCRDWRRGRFGTRQRLNLPLDDDRALTSSGGSVFGGAEGGSLPVALIGADPGASDHAAALDLRRAVNTLDDDLRLVVALRYYAGMDATAIGAALGVPSGTVRTRLKRALGVLRERLSAPDEQSGTGAPRPQSTPPALHRQEERR